MKNIAWPAMCGLLAACGSLSGNYVFAPELSGVVLVAGQPVANARVRLYSRFTNETQVALTDARGKFVVGPLTNFQFTVKQFGDAQYGYALQIAVEGHAVQGFLDEGTGEVPRKMVLTCDLSSAPGAGGGPSRGQTVCTPGR